MDTANLETFKKTLLDHEHKLRRAAAYVAEVPGACQGQRNESAYLLAAKIRELFGLEAKERLDVMRDWNQRCSPPLEDEEFQFVVSNPDLYGQKEIGSAYGPAPTPARGKKELHRPEAAQSKTQDGTEHPEEMTLDIICAHDIDEKELTWFWKNRIPEGMYSFIVGDPGSGKTFLSNYLAAVATTGGMWADGEFFGDAIDVLMFVAEDHLSKVFKRRLQDAGADLKRVQICQWIKTLNKSEIPFVIQQNVDVLKRYLKENPHCKLVTLDPITGYMGDANQNSQLEVREALMPVKTIAEQLNVTVIGLSHLNKKVDMDMQHRSIGSVAFNAIPRAVWGVFAKEDEEGFSDTKRRFFFPIKDNLCINPDALEFSIVNNAVCFGNKLSRLEMSGQINPNSNRAPSKKEQAKELILHALTKGDLESEELVGLCRQHDISERTATDARRELRAAGKIDTHNPEGRGFKWLLR